MMGEVIRVSGRGPDVGDLLKEAMLSQRFADVALCCSGGQRFLAHRLVLSAASPYLQEVLLAHGRAAGYNEPITMILADVEGAELAAILGLVYTGSATIQKSRLEAFTRAAETLHVRIPPMTGPPATTYLDPPPYRRLSTPAPFRLHRDVDDDEDEDDCSLDNVKIEGTSNFEEARYLRREKYPRREARYDRSSWYRDSRFGSSGQDFRRDDNTMSFGIFDAGTKNPFPDKSQTFLFEKRINLESAEKFERKDYHEKTDKSENIRPKEIDTVATDRTWFVDNSTISLSIDSSLLEHPATLRFGSVSGDENDYYQVGTGSSASNFVRVFAPPTDRRDVLLTTNVDSDNLEGVGRKDALAPSLSPDPRAPIIKSFERRNYDREARSLEVPIVGAGRSLPNALSTCATVTSEVVANVPSSTEIVARKNGEETCVENCCGWRRPRRHVANRVPASPWCQLARPAHHSPKTRSVLLCANGEASVETAGGPVGWTESVPSGERRTSSFAPSPAIGAIYDFKVPKTREISSNIDEESVGTVDVGTPRPNFYEARAPFIFPMEAIPPPTEGSTRTSSSNRAVVCRDLEPLPTRITAARRQPSPVGISENTISTSTGTAITVLDNNDPPTCDLRTSPRIELSHPVSRLCDIARTTDDVPTGPTDPTNRDHLSTTNNPLRTNLAMLGDVENNNRDAAPIFRAKTIFSTSSADIMPKNDDNNNEARIEEDGIDITGTGSGGEAVGAGNEEHRCDQCGKTFVTRASLKVHGRTHSGEKPFRCNDCGKEFSQLRNYKYHRSVHEGTREFAATCPECGKYFNDRGYLSSHMKIHRNRKEYGCAECGKSFNQRVAYNMHVRIHTGVKPHQCDQCGKAFSRKMLLKQHLRTHSGERPYQCQICHKAFADRSNMTLHTRLHSGLKPYQCTLCSKAFTKKHHLKTHLNYHTGTKPYSCPNCSLRFSQSSNMRTHYKKCSTINGGGTSQRCPTIRTNDTDEKASSIGASIPVNDPKGPSHGGNRATNCALTPPSSDQESSILAVSPVLAQERLARSISRGFVNEIRNKDIVAAAAVTNTIPGT